MATGCEHHGEHQHHGLAGAALARAVDAAESHCKDASERLTAPRRRVLELLLAADAPLKAYDLVATYDNGGEPAKPPTVYRALEFLERLGFAHRIESLNAYVPCRIDGAHVAAFLICDCCGEASEIQPNLGRQLEAAAEDGFAVRAVTLEARGLCAGCRQR
jgi:Fur family zinc uptake transcriptional regulator